jgi:protein-disulfide isomerase
MKKDFSIMSLFIVFLIISLAVFGVIEYFKVREAAQEAETQKLVNRFYRLPVKGYPSYISPYWTSRSTEVFEEAPIQIVVYMDFLCPDCLFLEQQLRQLKKEFAGKMNIAFQFFPLDGECNHVVDKDLHPGACELSYYAAADPNHFLTVHNEIFDQFEKARTSAEWRRDLAQKYGVYELAQDPSVREIVNRIIETGREYEKTSEKYEHGIRSTPTMIINGRMVIGTFPYEQMEALFQALVEEHEEKRDFIENWMPRK